LSELTNFVIRCTTPKRAESRRATGDRSHVAVESDLTEVRRAVGRYDDSRRVLVGGCYAAGYWAG